ncbi:MAG: hypothetical protein AAB400_05325 [Patescibacteria group bacterium]
MTKKLIIILSVTAILGGGLYFSKKKYFENDCAWRPTQKNYGLCEALLPGMFYDGKKCTMNSGCSWKGDIPPFKSYLQCKIACEL